MTETPALHTYKVGIMSTVRRVQAPSPLAAAVFYGLHTNGNMTFGAVVYEEDGQAYEGPAPWLMWQFGQGQPGDTDLEQLKAELRHCRFVRKGPA